MCSYKVKSAIIMLLAAVTFCVWPFEASADSESYQAFFPVTVTDTNQHIPDGTEFHLMIERKTKHAPLPAVNELVVGKSGTFTFGPIDFTEPGIYVYTVKELAQADDSIICDVSEYEIRVTVIRGEGGELEGSYSLSLEDSAEKPESITFDNDYRGSARESAARGTPSTGFTTDADSGTVSSTPADGSSDAGARTLFAPGTGEALSPAFAVLALSGTLAVVVWRKRKRRTRTEGEMPL